MKLRIISCHVLVDCCIQECADVDHLYCLLSVVMESVISSLRVANMDFIIHYQCDFRFEIFFSFSFVSVSVSVSSSV